MTEEGTSEVEKAIGWKTRLLYRGDKVLIDGRLKNQRIDKLETGLATVLMTRLLMKE